MEILIGLVVFVLGLCFGSFVNMLIYRVAINYKLEDPPSTRFWKGGNRSFCDFCGEQLKWCENVPVISWLIQKGKSRCCCKNLPVSYPVVELMMGILFIIFNFQFSIFNQAQIFNFQFSIGLVIIVFLVFSAVFDLKYMILPDFSTRILIFCASVLLLVEMSCVASLRDGMFLALVASGFLLILNLITKGKGMGMGDVKLAFFMGLFLGYPKIIVAFYVAFIVGAVWGLVLMIFKRVNKKTQVPFGPFLILGVLVAWWFGDLILKFVNIRLGL